MPNPAIQQSQNSRAQRVRAPQAFIPLEQVTSPTVATNAAAYYLNRRPQTLRAWACLETGAIRPLRINGRLAWSVAAIRALIGSV